LCWAGHKSPDAAGLCTSVSFSFTPPLPEISSLAPTRRNIWATFPRTRSQAACMGPDESTPPSSFPPIAQKFFLSLHQKKTTFFLASSGLHSVPAAAPPPFFFFFFLKSAREVGDVSPFLPETRGRRMLQWHQPACCLTMEQGAFSPSPCFSLFSLFLVSRLIESLFFPRDIRVRCSRLARTRRGPLAPPRDL